MKKNIFFLILLLYAFGCLAQQKTIAKGIVLDAKTKEPVSYATVVFSEGGANTNTDAYGKFLIEKNGNASTLKISAVGYVTKKIKINALKTNELEVNLVENIEELRELVVKPQKYKKKNPAVDLVEQVFLNKDKNRKESLNYYQFDTHEKLRFEINGVTEKFKNRFYFKPFRFAFDYCDTNTVNQKITLPFFFRERLLTTFYRQFPNSKKEQLHAERQTAFEEDYDVDKEGISQYITNMYAEIDIYSPIITLLNKEFIGPLSGNATSFYRFYITDTIKTSTEKMAAVYFSPINKNDLAFMGTMLIALDSTYAIRKVDMGISKDINLNWVSNIKIAQQFDFQGNGTSRRLVVTDETMALDMKIWKNREGRSILATKQNFYKNYALNQPLPDSIYAGKVQLKKDTGNLARTFDFWRSNRIDSLQKIENELKIMVDSVKTTKAFKVLEGFGKVMTVGFIQSKYIDFGQVGTLVRYNELEGLRLQGTVRANPKAFPKIRWRTYLAYGFLDQQWKYGSFLTYAFKNAKPSRFPVNQMRISYEKNLQFPGAGNNSVGLAGSLQRPGTVRMLWNENYNAAYMREFLNGFSYNIFGNRKFLEEASLQSTENQDIKPTATTIVGGFVRYAPNEKFYQGVNERVPIRSKAPVFMLNYRAGIKGLLGGEFAFQKVDFRIDKYFYLKMFGKSTFSLETGAIFGRVSYPLLEIHRANQSFIFDETAFSQMNYLEFVSDRYATLHYNHDFQGILLNRIPLIKKMRLREGITFKALYGGLSKNNTPTANNGLQPFPINEDGIPLTQSLGNQPYMEMGVGVGNILGGLRIEYIRRLSYLNLPNVQKEGLKIMFAIDF
jgi:Family of unknown function (DUF5686)/CarboxypepD_reg-like domain